MIDAWLPAATARPEISDGLVGMSVKRTPVAEGLVMHRDLRQEQPVAALIESFVAQHQQRPVVPAHTTEISASTSPINHQLIP